MRTSIKSLNGQERARRGRPREYEPEAVLAAALDLFRQQGYAATSLDQLSAATGLNRPSLYGGFGDKRSLYLAALNHYRAQAQERMMGALQRRGERESNAAGLRRFYRAAIALYAIDSLGCPVMATATTEAPMDQEVQRLVAEVLTEGESALRAWLAALTSGNERASPRAIAGMAALLASVWQSLSIRARAGQSASELKLGVNAAVKVFEQWESSLGIE